MLCFTQAESHTETWHWCGGVISTDYTSYFMGHFINDAAAVTQNHSDSTSIKINLYNKGKTRNLERDGIILAEFGSTRRFVDLLRWTH